MRFGVEWVVVGTLCGCAGNASSTQDFNAAGGRDAGRGGAGSSGGGATSGGSAGHREEGGGGRTIGGNGGGSAGGQPVTAGLGGEVGQSGEAGQSGGVGQYGEGGHQEQHSALWNGLLDPGFKGVPANTWLLSPDAALEPTAVTHGVDPGQLKGNLCHGSSRVTATASQQFDAPSFAAAGPSALVVRWQAQSGFNAQLAARLRGRNLLLRQGESASQWAIQRGCLGESAYGAGLKLELALSGSCFSPNYALIDRVDFVLDGACPSPGLVANGDFESNDGWKLWNQGIITTEILDGIGPTATRALHFKTTAPDQSGGAIGSMSVPLSSSLQNPMLRMKVKGTVGSMPLSLTAGVSHAVIKGTGSFESLGLCLFDYEAGTVSELAFDLHGAGDFTVDDLTLESNAAACPSPLLIADGGFEQSGVISTWVTSVDGAATIQIESDATTAHSGSSYLHMSMTDECGGPRASTSVVVPSPTASAGPALRLFYRRPAPEAHSVYTITIPPVSPAGYDTLLLPPTDVWKEKIVCLPPGKAGEIATVNFMAGGSTCGNVPAEDLFVDDITMTTDPSCPAQ